MRFLLLINALLCSLLLSNVAQASDTIVVRHYQHEARYQFGLKVLNLALSKLNKPYEIIGPKSQVVNEARGEAMVINGRYDLEVLSTTADRESKMIPIKIPVYQGLLGLRLLLVTPQLNTEISKVRNIDALRQFIGGHGLHWADLGVYKANNLKVVTAVNYDKLFEMLKKHRFDYFHRGANEIWDELERYKNDFVIADNIMLYYPQPAYFFISKHRPELAQQIEQGLQLAIKDGSYKALFLSHYQDTIANADLASRHLITLKNPTVPSDTPIIDTSWWLPQHKLKP
ncbi:transporter substrate-binding domain-containing protein [Alkalimarinus sediminis]|uniref:Transporter substrate-binding domain-containing protein n=1 Tax=Alkalimarinus sediminis TaxID=1632866 RepID=A0A9E8HQV3_9ALTE|nr:transporter substrate-binding domain-containing protein [Alkalimarinus sediminis]UZW74846.1 transporter substrate-binding domain-containing protein [Alkalimarinus sediminis]